MLRRTTSLLPLLAALAWLIGCSNDQSLGPEEQQSFNAGEPAQQNLIRDQYIVVFNDNVASPVQLANGLAVAHGLQLRHTYRHAFKGFSAVFPAQAAAALRRNPNVRFVEQNAYGYVDTHERLRAQLLVDFPSAVSDATAARVKPPLQPPINLHHTAVTDITIDLLWEDQNTDETGWEVWRSVTGSNGTFKIHEEVRGPPGPEGSYTDEEFGRGLTPAMEYCYQVRAYKMKRRGRHYSSFSNTHCATTLGAPPPPPPPPPAPPAPTNLTATTVDHQRISLAWDDVTGEDEYIIERCEGTGAGCVNFTEIDRVGTNLTAYNDINLNSETEYCYQVTASNTGGASPPSNSDCDTTDAAPPLPPPPAGCSDNGAHDDLTDPGLWGIVKVRANQNPKWLGIVGNGPLCAMTPTFYGIDTGVDSDHPDLNVAQVKCFLAGSPGCTGEDDHGHGTHTAGTAAAIDGGPAGGVVGVAPGTQIVGFKVCDATGLCPYDDIIAAVDEVTARKNANPNQAMVANMSLGGGWSDALDMAVRRSVNAGVVYALSAGNGLFNGCVFPNDAQNTSPARVGDDRIVGNNGSKGDTRPVNGVITTTSSNSSDNDVNCNYGNPVTVAAPGTGIKSTWLNGGYNTIGGTSMAAPHTAGAAILYLQDHPSATPTEVEQAILNLLDPWTTDELPNAGGRLNVSGL
jgi:hypothetical protein